MRPNLIFLSPQPSLQGAGVVTGVRQGVVGANYAREHPEVLVVVVQSAASDWAAARLAIAIERVAEALLLEDAPEQQGIVAARGLPWSRP